MSQRMGGRIQARCPRSLDGKGQSACPEAIPESRRESEVKILILWFQSAVFDAWMQGRWVIDMRSVRFINCFMPEKKPPSGAEK